MGGLRFAGHDDLVTVLTMLGAARSHLAVQRQFASATTSLGGAASARERRAATSTSETLARYNRGCEAPSMPS